MTTAPGGYICAACEAGECLDDPDACLSRRCSCCGDGDSGSKRHDRT